MNVDYCIPNPFLGTSTLSGFTVNPLVKVNIISPESKTMTDLTVKT